MPDNTVSPDDQALFSRTRLTKPASYFGLKSVEDGVDRDQSVRLKDAMESGMRLDGENRSFNVDGNLSPEALGGIVNIRLRQLTPLVPGRRTLDLSNLSDFVIENVMVDGGGQYTGPATYLSNNGQIYLAHCRSFSIVGSRAERGGAGNGIAFASCTDFDVSDLTVRDLHYDLPDVTDDIVQGIWFNNCARFTARRLSVSNLTGRIADRNSRRFTRGIAAGGCETFVVDHARVQHVDQGIDITGSVGNRDFLISNCRIRDVETWGVKCANTTRRGTIMACAVDNSGLSGFVASPVLGPSVESPDTMTSDLTFRDCHVRNPGGSAVSRGNSYAGFNIISTPQQPTVPNRIAFIDCTATDDRGKAALMTYGFVNATPNDGLPTELRNRLVNCRSMGQVEAPFAGFE